MATRPYLTHGGLRIRQCFNARVIETRRKRMTAGPTGATREEWEKWQDWSDGELLMWAQWRDHAIAEAKAAERRAKYERRHRK